MAKTKLYRGPGYWEKERPVEAAAKRLLLRYFPQAGKLQISKAYRDRETGELRHGITVTLDQEDIFLHPEARLILRALVEWV